MREFIEKLEQDQRELDEYVRHRLPTIGQVSCSSCTHASPGCCSQKVMITFHEALPIARYLKRYGMDTVALRERLLELGNGMEGTDRKAWFDGAHPCAFLLGGRCTVYDARPVACRTYFVKTDQANCQPGAPDNSVKFADMSEAIAQSMGRARIIHQAMGLRETNKRILIGALPRLVLIALEAWDRPDAEDFIRLQTWPSDDDIRGRWFEGDNPFTVAAP